MIWDMGFKKGQFFAVRVADIYKFKSRQKKMLKA